MSIKGVGWSLIVGYMAPALNLSNHSALQRNLASLDTTSLCFPVLAQAGISRWTQSPVVSPTAAATEVPKWGRVEGEL